MLFNFLASLLQFLPKFLTAMILAHAQFVFSYLRKLKSVLSDSQDDMANEFNWSSYACAGKLQYTKFSERLCAHAQ